MCQNMQMQWMVNEVERFAKEYKEKRGAIDTKNQAESVVFFFFWLKGNFIKD